MAQSGVDTTVNDPNGDELNMEQQEHRAKAISGTTSLPAKHSGGDPTTVYLVAAAVALAGLLLTIFVG